MSRRLLRQFIKPQKAKLATEQLESRLVPDGLAAQYFPNMTLTGTAALAGSIRL